MAKIFSSLEKASLENSASDPTTTSVGRIYFNTTSKIVKWLSEAGVWKTALDTNSTQTITNKDIDGGTASDSLRITVPKNATATLTGLTRKEGTIVFDSTLKTFKGDDGTNLNIFASTSAATPTASGIVTSFTPTIKSRYKEINNADYTVLDTDGYDHITSTTTLTADRTVTLPTAADNAGRRITVTKADSGAYNIIVKGEAAGETINGISGSTGVKVFPRYISMTFLCTGSVWVIVDAKLFSDWVSYTPSLSNFTQGSSNVYFSYRRYGDCMDIQASINNLQSSANFGASSFAHTLPFSLAMNNSVLDTSVGYDMVGWGKLVNTNGNQYLFNALRLGTSTSVIFFECQDYGVNPQLITSTTPVALSLGSQFRLYARIPISTWATQG